MLSLPAPAKLNLMLHITGRRDDGYHELQTVFALIDYADRLEFSARDDDLLRRLAADDFGVAPGEDIIMRAAEALRSSYANRGLATGGVDIRLQKRIPMGAGLGGGSSDAATTLLALNHLWGGHLDIDELAKIGLELGADVPVFVRGRNACGEGVGEKLTPLDLPVSWYLVIVPPCHVSTARLFSHPDLTRDCSAIKICDLLRTESRNVFTEVVINDYPEVLQAIDILGKYAEARMSGSGASVFAEFGSEQEADGVLQEIRADSPVTSWTSFVARGLTRSPVHQQLGISA